MVVSSAGGQKGPSVGFWGKNTETGFFAASGSSPPLVTFTPELAAGAREWRGRKVRAGGAESWDCWRALNF